MRLINLKRFNCFDCSSRKLTAVGGTSPEAIKENIFEVCSKIVPYSPSPTRIPSNGNKLYGDKRGKIIKYEERVRMTRR